MSKCIAGEIKLILKHEDFWLVSCSRNRTGMVLWLSSIFRFGRNNGYFFNPCSESVKAKRKCDACCDNKILVFDEVVALQKKKKVRRDPFKEKLLIRSKDHLAEELIDSFSNLVHKQGLFLIFKWFLSVRWFP